MKQEIYLMFFLLINNYLINAQQNFTIVKAPDLYSFHSDSRSITVKDNKLLLINQMAEELYLQKYDTDMNRENESKYGGYPKVTTIEKTIHMQDKTYSFYSYWDKEKEKDYLGAREINFEKLDIAKDHQTLSIANRIIGENHVNGPHLMGYRYNFFPSSDQSKLLVQYLLDDNNASKTIGLCVFDKDLNSLWKKEILLPYVAGKIKILNYSIDKEGQVYIIAKVYITDVYTEINRNDNPDITNYRLELLKINENGIIKTTSITLDKKFLMPVSPEKGKEFNYTNSIISEKQNGNIFCVNLYHRGRNQAEGFFSFEIDKDGSILNSQEIPFPINIIEPDISKQEKLIQKGKVGFSYLTLREMHEQNDGSFIIITEQYSYGEGNNGPLRHYHDAVISKINSSNKLEWIHAMDKESYIGIEGSYRYIKKNGTHYIFYISDDTNFFVTSIDDKTGEIKSKELFKKKDFKGKISIDLEFTLFLSENEVLARVVDIGTFKPQHLKCKIN